MVFLGKLEMGNLYVFWRDDWLEEERILELNPLLVPLDETRISLADLCSRDAALESTQLV